MGKDLTSGSVFKSLVAFSLPYLLSYFLQTLYGMADLFIIGQFCAVASTTAVSIGSQVMHMITVMIVGLAMGATVSIARAVGAKDGESERLATGNTVTMFLVLSVVATVLLLVFLDTLVSVMATPAESVLETTQYLKICFIGIPFITAYNILSSIFRGMGDSKSPMYFIAVACVFNIALDYLFIGKLGLGAGGAALGTTISQSISVVIALVVIAKKKMMPGFKLLHLKPAPFMAKQILKVGFPIAVQDGFIQISFIIITIFANRRGVHDAAAVGVVEKMIGIFFLVPSSISSAVSALAAQNIGAKKNDRAWAVLKYAILITSAFGIFFTVVMQFAAERSVGLFTSDAMAVRLGGQYMRSYVVDCFVAGIHFCCSGIFAAWGLSGLSFLHNSISAFCVRIPLAYVASTRFPATLFPMGFAAPIGSTVSVIICVVAILWMKTKPQYASAK